MTPRSTLFAVACVFAVLCITHEAQAYNARWMRARSQSRDILEGVKIYRTDTGAYPVTDASSTWFKKLNEKRIIGDEDGFQGLSEGIPLDPWGHPFVYIPPANLAADPGDIAAQPLVYSLGENGIDDHGEKDDLVTNKPINDGYYCYRDRPRARVLAAVMPLGFMPIGIIFLRVARYRWFLVCLALWYAALILAVCIPMTRIPWDVGGMPAPQPLGAIASAAGMVVVVLPLLLVFARPVRTALRKLAFKP